MAFTIYASVIIIKDLRLIINPLSFPKISLFILDIVPNKTYRLTFGVGL
jgi:hypothetical protein